MFEDLLRSWDGEEVAVRYDAASDAWMFVCVHSTALGPGAGGTRMKVYAAPHDALADGLRLASAMTRKNAVAGLPLGGGKAVIAVPEIPQGGARRDLLLGYADLVTSLGGTYMTACDMNTSERDMDLIGERSPFVFGRSVHHGGSGSSAPSTAVGVFHAIRASVEHVFGWSRLSGRTVAIQGVGAVGHRLAELLAEAGAALVLADIEEVRAKEVAAELGAEVVPAADAIEAECDVFSPCATGGVLNAATIPRLRCRIVCGAANNQLAELQDAELFAESGILYGPDFVANAGGIVHLASRELLGEDEATRDARLAGIGVTLSELFGLAEAEGVSTADAAERIALERISHRRDWRRPGVTAR